MPTVQKKILLSRYSTTFRSYYSSVAGADIPANTKIVYLFNFLKQITDIELNCPDWMTTLDKLEIHQMRIMIISDMLSFRGKGGNLMIMSLATSLSSILIGLQRIEVDQLLRDEKSPDYSRRLALTFNLLNEYFVIFSSLINNLNEIHQRDFDSWIEIVIHNLFQLVQLLRMRWDVAEIYRRGGGFQNFAFVFTTYVSVIQTLIQLYSKTRRNLSGFNDFRSDEVFLKLITSLRDEVQSKINELLDANENGIFGRNNNALESMAVKNSLTAFHQIQSLPELYTNLRRLTLNQDIDVAWLEAEVNRLQEYCREYYICHSDEAVLSSDYGEGSIQFFQDALLVHGLYAREKNSLEVLDNFRTLSGQFLSDKGRSYNPSLYAFFLFMRIYALDTPQPEDIRELKDITIQTSPRLEFFYSYLSQFASLAIGDLTVEEFFATLVSEHEKLMSSISNQKVLDNLQEYIDGIYKVSCGDRAEINLTNLMTVNPMDPCMVLLPNFRVVINQEEIYYVPLYGIEEELVTSDLGIDKGM